MDLAVEEYDAIDVVVESVAAESGSPEVSVSNAILVDARGGQLRRSSFEKSRRSRNRVPGNKKLRDSGRLPVEGPLNRCLVQESARTCLKKRPDDLRAPVRAGMRASSSRTLRHAGFGSNHDAVVLQQYQHFREEHFPVEVRRLLFSYLALD